MQNKAHLAVRAAVVLALTAAASAQIRIDTYASRHVPGLTPGSTWPIEANDFANGDFDADGDLDVVIADNRGAPLFLRNLGDGVFAAPVSLPVAHGRTTLATAFDFDNDGDLDLFFCGGGTAYGSSRPCALVRNDGTGSFAPFGSLPTTLVDATNVSTGDLDGDGDLDVVVAGWNGVYLRNDGGGTFSDQTASLPGFGDLCHFDGDAHLDIVGTSTVWFGTGGGAFTSFALPGFRQFLGDLDGDGDLDFVGGNPMRIHRNDGTGRVFQVSGSVPLPPNQPWRTPRLAVDLDGNGTVELVELDVHARPVVMHHGGDFVYSIANGSYFETTMPTAVDIVWTAFACFDADGDGDRDWLTGAAEGRSTSSTTVGIPPKLYLDAGTGPGPRFVEATKTPFPRLQYSASPAAAGDVDGDGDADLVFDGLWLQDRNGRYVPGPALPPPAGFQFFPRSGPGLLVDLDTDGDLDLFLTDGPGRGFPASLAPPRLCRNDGTGAFTAVAVPPTVSTVGTSCAAGDVDGDGDLDLVLGSRSPDFQTTGARVVLLRNEGNMVFVDAAAQVPSLLYETGYVALADVDADSDLDLVLGSDLGYHSTPSVRLFVNDGTGHFSDQTSTRLPLNADGIGLAVADLDGDGDVDFTQKQSFGGSSYDYTNNGNGVFTVQAGTRGTHVVDWRGDGTLVDVDENVPDGFAVDGTFVTWTFGWGGAIPTELLPFDCDQDGDLDLAVGCLPTWSSGQYSAFHQGLVVNLHRDLRFASQPRIGQPLRLALRAVNGTAATVAFVATTTGLLPQRVPAPGLGGGTIAVDVNQLVALDLALVPDADTAAEVVRTVPSSTVFLGLTIAAQALFVPVGNEAAAHFSNAVVETIAR